MILISQSTYSATIAIIDTGFDLDHEFLKPNILKQETDEEALGENLKSFSGWQFHDNSHLKEAVVKDESTLQEILLYRNLKAKGHTDGLSLQEFEWFKNKRSDKTFIEKVKHFRKHTHGTFVAGVALREGENINIFPIRGLNIAVPVVAVEDNSSPDAVASSIKNPEERFKDEIKLSIKRVSKKFSKICRYLSLNNINVVNASYGITYKNTMTKFREKYRDITNKDIDETFLKTNVDEYFSTLYQKGQKTISRYPKMLFVFSAGNSGNNNDEFHHYPSRIKLPNTISVAATNGEYLASFSNYGKNSVDVGAPGVAILSLVPRIYSSSGKDLYSPSSGTSMAAPHISNLAAQVLNANNKLTAEEIKEIIVKTGDEKSSLKDRINSGAIANNQRALNAALLSRDLKLDVAINLARSELIPLEDTISFGQPPARAFEPPKDFTNSESSSPTIPEIAPQDSSNPPPSTPQVGPEKSFDQGLSNQIEAPLLQPSVDSTPSSSPLESQPLPIQNPDPSPSSP